MSSPILDLLQSLLIPLALAVLGGGGGWLLWLRRRGQDSGAGQPPASRQATRAPQRAEALAPAALQAARPAAAPADVAAAASAAAAAQAPAAEDTASASTGAAPALDSGAAPSPHTPPPARPDAVAQATLAKARQAAAPAGGRSSGRSRAPKPAPALPWRADVLVVDDSAVVRAKLRKLLAPAGYTLDQAHDGEQALLLLGQGRYGLMVTDLEMPKLDGIGLISAALAQPGTAGMPILAITGHEDLQSRLSQLQSVQGIHRKPWDDTALLADIQALVAPGVAQAQPAPASGAPAETA